MVNLDEISPQSGINVQIQTLNRELQANPNNHANYYKRSKLLFEAGNYEKSYIDVNNAIALDSTVLYYYILKAKVSRNLNKIVTGINAVLKAEMLGCTDPEIYMLGGELFFIIKEYQKSMNFLNKALRINKFEFKVYFFKGLNLLEMGDTIAAISSLQTCAEQEPDFYQAYDQLAMIHQYQEHYDLALQFQNSAISIKKDDPYLWYNRGISYFYLNKFEEAISDFSQAIALDSSLHVAHFNLGNCYYNQKKYSEAKTNFAKAVKLNPMYTPGWFILGQTLEWQEDFKEALDAYQKAFDLDRDYEAAEKSVERMKAKLK